MTTTNKDIINRKKTLSEKILLNNENKVCNVIKDFETSIYSIITNILLLLKNNDSIYHTNNYILYNYNSNDIMENNIPIMILLGGSSYKIYSLFYNKYFKKDIIDLNDCLIDSIDYDFSIVVKPNFDKNIFKLIITTLIKNNINEFININNSNKIQYINDDDIKNDIFLNGKNKLPIVNNGNSLNNILLTYSYGSVYFSIQISIKINGKIYQIIELLFWRNEIISNTIYLKDFEINKCLFFQTDKFKILLPDVSVLLKTNIISMKFRLLNKEFNKCAKDYYRLRFIDLINDKNSIDIENIKDDFMELSIKAINKIYKKDNPDLFKLPNSICSLNDIIKQEKIFNLYNDFLNLDLDEQINILTNYKHNNDK
jgi:hypothetical protein